MKFIEALESCNKSVIFFNKIRNDLNNASLLNWDKFSVESIDSTINYIKKNRGELYIIVLDEKYIGYVKFTNRYDYGKNYIPFLEIGIFISKNYRGLGFGTKAISYAVSKLRKNSTILADVNSLNIKSIKAFEKCGFTVTYRLKVKSKQDLQDSEMLYLIYK